MALEEAEDSVLTLKTLPQIEDAEITFTDDGGEWHEDICLFIL